MELVAGATGMVGGRVALGLRARGRQLRAMVRGGPGRAEAAPLLQAGVEVVDADVTRPASLASACQDIDTVLCTITTMPHGRDDGLRRVDLEGVLALIEAAEQAAVRRFVYTSYSGNISIESPLGHAKRTCEQRLRESGMESLILRPSYFMEVWLGPHVGFDPAGGRVRLYGTGATPVSYVSAFDVAELAVAAAVHAERGSRILELGGPDALSLRDVVGIFEKAMGRNIAVDAVPLAALEEQYRSAGDPLQKSFAALTLNYALGDPIADARMTAEHYGVRLRSVADLAGSGSPRASS